MGAASAGTEGAGTLKRLQKRLREAERLQLRQENGDALSAEEHIKAESAAVLRAQIALLVQPATPTAAGAIGSAHSSGAVASAAPTQPAASRVACLAENFNAAAESLESLPSEPKTSTRANHIRVEVLGC